MVRDDFPTLPGDEGKWEDANKSKNRKDRSKICESKTSRKVGQINDSVYVERESLSDDDG